MSTQYSVFPNSTNRTPYANAAALTAVSTSRLYNGYRAQVSGLGCFKLSKLSVAAPNGTTVIQAANGGNWLVDYTPSLVLNELNQIDGSQVADADFLGIADGSAASPSLYFTDDNNTGMYRVEENHIGFSTGGELRLSINDTATTLTNLLYMPDGTESAPCITFAGDPNTGIWKGNNADAFHVTCGGNTVLIFNTLGIDITGVSSVLKVNTLQVVGPRKTGWTIMTGSAQRGTFATGSVTLPQLAGVVMALQQDLGSTAGGHGLIDA